MTRAGLAMVVACAIGRFLQVRSESELGRVIVFNDEFRSGNT
jgi:hypothetical protein